MKEISIFLLGILIKAKNEMEKKPTPQLWFSNQRKQQIQSWKVQITSMCKTKDDLFPVQCQQGRLEAQLKQKHSWKWETAKRHCSCWMKNAEKKQKMHSQERHSQTHKFWSLLSLHQWCLVQAACSSLDTSDFHFHRRCATSGNVKCQTILLCFIISVVIKKWQDDNNIPGYLLAELFRLKTVTLCLHAGKVCDWVRIWIAWVLSWVKPVSFCFVKSFACFLRTCLEIFVLLINFCALCVFMKNPEVLFQPDLVFVVWPVCVKNCQTLWTMLESHLLHFHSCSFSHSLNWFKQGFPSSCSIQFLLFKLSAVAICCVWTINPLWRHTEGTGKR